MTKNSAPRQDVYTRVTDKIVADLEQGVRPWMKPWNAEHAAGRITKPLRHNGQPYNGINILMLWSAAVSERLQRPDLDDLPPGQGARRSCAQGREGRACRLRQHHHPHRRKPGTGEDVEQTIPFMKGYTVFNVEQIEDLPPHYYQLAEPVLDPVQRIEHAERFFAATGADIRHGGNQAYYASGLRSYPDAALRKLPRRRKLLRHTGP